MLYAFRMLCLFLLLLAGTLLGHAQEWYPISPAAGYYAWQLDGTEEYRFIKVLSASQEGATSLYLLNQNVAICDTCELPLNTCIYDPSVPMFRRDDPHFLQKEIRTTGGEYFHLSDTGSVAIWVASGPGGSWLWDTLANISAMVQTVEEVERWGSTDSVKTILLSSGDTVLLAKNWGLLQYPDGYGTGRYFRLQGIQALELGLPMPSARDIFDLEVGDRFELAIYESAFSAYTDIIRQFEIQTKTVTQEGFRYTVSGRQLVEGYDPYGGGQTEQTGPYTGELTYQAGIEYFLNDVYSGVHETVGDFGFGMTEVPGSYIEEGEWGLPELRYGYTNWGYCVSSQSGSIVPGVSLDGFAVRYLPGIGEVRYLLSTSEMSVSRRVVAWQRGATVLGTFSPDSIFEDAIAPPPAPGIPNEYSLGQSFPNPGRDRVWIPFGLPVETIVTIDLYDFQGRHAGRILDGVTLPASHFDWEYEVSNLSGGLYYLRMEAAGRVFVSKMSVTHQ